MKGKERLSFSILLSRAFSLVTRPSTFSRTPSASHLSVLFFENHKKKKKRDRREREREREKERRSSWRAMAALQRERGRERERERERERDFDGVWW